MVAKEDARGLPRALAIVGPTGSGKAKLGLEVAQRYAQPILVCDSVKVYRGLDIGSAKPSADAQAVAPHHLIDLAAPDQTFSAGDYARAAQEHLSASRLALFVGGTGFYLRGVVMTHSGGEQSGLASAPDDATRVAFEHTWELRERDDPGDAHRALCALDPQTSDAIHPNNFVRLVRALWLCEIHGGAVSTTRRQDLPRARLDVLGIVLDPGPEPLRCRIAHRGEVMFEAGWLAEVERLVAAGYDERHKAMRSLGYRQLLEVVRGRASLQAAREQIVLATRQFARRQRTYFRHQLPTEDVVHISDPKDMPWARIDDFAQAARG